MLHRLRFQVAAITLGLTCLTWAGEDVTCLTDDLSAWRGDTGTWSVVDRVTLDADDNKKLSTHAGPGGIVNGPTGRTLNIVSQKEFSDVQAHIEFMIPQGSNSGIYFMGRYELQIYDSHGVDKDKYPGIECGGIYERWDERRTPKGFEGHSPRVNASRAPGEWQSFDVVFRAPRFNDRGQKIANAKFEKVLHNDVLIHEDVELTGPTRASIYQDERSDGPIMLQGDHGPIAYRNIRLSPAPPMSSAKTALPSLNSDTQIEPDQLGFDEIVFVKRKPYSSDHYYTDIDNGTSPDRFVPENGVSIYDVRTRTERSVVTAADLPGGKGLIGKISLSFDARKIVFDFRQDPRSGFRIWEVKTDGSGLRQISFPPIDEAEKVARWGKPWHTDDIHPAYLPDGKIVFASTRCEHTVLCGGSAHLAATALHRMDPDGRNIEQLTHSPVNEFCPVVLDDGRIMYHRWEYIDRGARVGKTLWSINPDGTGARELYGVEDDTTTVYMYPQPIPGQDERVVCVGTCHYPQGGCLGAIMLIDFNRGAQARGPDPDEADYVHLDDRYAVKNMTPHVFIERRTEPGWFFRTEQGRYVHDRDGRQGHLYTHPFPISDREFLVSFKADPSDHYKNVPDAYSLYLIDIEGNHFPIHKDEQLSCWHPLPLVPRAVPPNVRSSVDSVHAASDQALCVLTDVYQGMPGVERGEVKWLRINEALPRYWDTGRRWSISLSSSGWKAALWPRVQWGVVPVEADGSAQFVVPADRSIFLQALDKDYREIQRERTYVSYRPGEVRSCTGCHGRAEHNATPAGSETPLALMRAPSMPQPQPCDLVENGGDGRAGQVIHYPTDIQPIFDAKCVACHNKTEPAGDLNLSGDLTLYYNTSYEELAKKCLAGPIIPEFTSFEEGDRGNYNGAFLPPKSLGGYQSRLIDILTDPAHPENDPQDHSQMLTKMEQMILSRWADTNYQFYGAYYGRHHWHWTQPDPNIDSYDPQDFRRKATFEEATRFFAPPWHR